MSSIAGAYVRVPAFRCRTAPADSRDEMRLERNGAEGNAFTETSAGPGRQPCQAGMRSAAARQPGAAGGQAEKFKGLPSVSPTVHDKDR